jgi:hypothetical protein
VSAGVSENSAAKHVYRAPAVRPATTCAAPEVVTSTHAVSPAIGQLGGDPAFYNASDPQRRVHVRRTRRSRRRHVHSERATSLGTTAVNVGGISAAVSTPGAHTRYVSAGVSENSAAKHVYRAPAGHRLPAQHQRS